MTVLVFMTCQEPGEGEHKIMDYIRHQKAQPTWEPNTKHCLYGLDADLIMLALTTHEPHFILLREEVLSKHSKKGKSDSERFHLLHIGLLREYFDLEMKKLKLSIDLERMIDDFVLMCFFVGNDFLPHLPSMDIADNALNYFLDIYRDILIETKDYLTNGANINYPNLERFITQISKREREYFEFLPISGVDKLTLTSSRGSDVDFVGLDSSTESLKSSGHLRKSDDVKRKRFQNDLKALGVSDDDVDNYDDQTWKDVYYRDKFQATISDPQHAKFHRALQQSYFEGIVWVLNYYHNGCVSWSWFYPYHYAPLVSGSSLSVNNNLM